MKTPSRICIPMAAHLAPLAFYILVVVSLLCSSGCSQKTNEGSAETKDYGWFSYAPPEGWKRLNMSQDGTSVAFLPDHAVRDTGVGLVEISQVDWLKHVKKGDLAAAVIGDLKQHWEHDCELARRDGKPPPPFACDEIPGMIEGPGQIEAFSVQLVRNGRSLRFLKHFIELPDGRRFIVEYNGSDPGYTDQLAVVTKSLKTIRFADVSESVPSR
jgi:hypothetical protein